jgi:hypothetical protein
MLRVFSIFTIKNTEQQSPEEKNAAYKTKASEQSNINAPSEQNNVGNRF